MKFDRHNQPTVASQAHAPVRVWDLPVRVFHWALVLLVGVSAITGWFAAEVGSEGMEWHKRSGYCILASLLFRIAWGVVGSTHARFTNFVKGPGAVARYAAGLLRGHVRYAGHNPLGGWSVLLMLLSLAAQTVSGLFIEDEDLGVEGPLAHLVSSRTGDALAALHEANFFVLIALIVLHLAAVLFYLAVKRENLILPMLTGLKRLPPEARAAAHFPGTMRAAVLFGLAAALVYWIAR